MIAPLVAVVIFASFQILLIHVNKVRYMNILY